MEQIRINKYLCNVGVCSRREADRLIADGRVLVNGIAAQNGQRVSDEDDILVDGKNCCAVSDIKEIILAFNKPVGIVCSSNGQGAQTVDEYLKLPYRVFSVGRLDKRSEGLLLLTNNGELANAIAKARFCHEKEYSVRIDKEVDEIFLKKMAAGVPILDTVTRPCKIRKTGVNTFNIILTQGLNRQIRRMCEACGATVIDLKRTRIMNISLGELKSGAVRELTESEKNKLFKLSGLKRSIEE